MSIDKQRAGADGALGTLNMDALLKHENFVRSVVRRLISDDAAVQDVVQNTWVQAMEHPPEAKHGDRSMAAWLARVATNLVRSMQRSEGRRSHREGAVAKLDVDDSWEESVDRLESRQRVVEAVLALQEPYRTVVVLRYDRGHSVEQIAKELERSQGTVRSQLSRAHESLRMSLDRDFGDRNSWAVLAIPLGGGMATPGSGTVTAGTQPSIANGASGAGIKGAGKVGTGSNAMIAVVSLVAVSAVLGAVWRFSKAADIGALDPVETVLTEVGKPRQVELAAIEHAPDGRDAVTVESTFSEPKGGSWNGPPPETLLPRAHLLNQSKYNNYEASTFSFEHGIRDDPGGLTRNDWGISFRKSIFRSDLVTDDRSILVDLGKVHLADVQPEMLNDAAQGPRMEVKLGHSYLLWERDTQTDLVSAFEVVGLEITDHCELDWYTVNAIGQASGSFHEDGVGPLLVETMRAFRVGFQGSNPLSSARIWLQARAGHQGGNPCRINALGEINAYFDGKSDEPLELLDPIMSRTPSLGYAEGGTIPAGMVFMVNRVTYRGTHEDGQPRGEFEIIIGDQSIVPEDYAKDLSLMVWTGAIPIRAGAESDITLIVSYYSQGEAFIEGEFIKDEGEESGVELLASGMALFPKLEIPKGRGARFATGELTQNNGRGPDFDIYFDGAKGRFRAAQVYSLGPVALGSIEVDQVLGKGAEERVPLVLGHSYLLVQPLNRYTLFHVESLAVGETCTLDWFSVSHIGQVTGSYQGTQAEFLEHSIEQFHRAARERLELKEPLVHLQLRIQSQGGNRCKVSMDGKARRVDLSTEALTISGAPIRKEDEQGYCQGGLIPEGQVFVVSRVEYRVLLDFNGNRRKRSTVIRVGQTQVLEELDLESDLNGEWTGRIELRPGSESSVSIEAVYRTSVDVKISGELIPDPKVKAR